MYCRMDTSVKAHHGRYVCTDCNEQFALKASLKQHLSSKHSISKRQTQDYYSKLSDNVDEITSVSSYDSEAFLGAHSEYSHSNIYNGVYPTAQASSTNTIPEPTPLKSTVALNRWPYDEIDKTLDARNRLEQHQEGTNFSRILTDTETSGYETDATVIAADTPLTLYKCEMCGKSFDVEWKFDQHNGSDGHLQRQRQRIKAQSQIDDRKLTEDDTSGYETEKPLIAATSAPQRSFYCHTCTKTFEVESRYVQHMNSDGHKQKVKQLKDSNELGKPTELFPCSLEECGRKFDSEVKLLQHQGMKHGIKVGVVEPEGNGSETEFRCTEDECDKVFPSKSRLLQHMRDKHPVNKNDPSAVRRLCEDCDEFNETAGSKPFIFLTFIAKHILTVHEKPGYIKGTCPICHNRVEKQKNLLTHISRAHLFSKFKDEACFICLRLCKDKDDLLQHSTSVHRFKCAIDSCHSMFPSKPLRDKHMLDKHSVYGCGFENCQRIFPTLDEKIAHMRTPHKGEASELAIACSHGRANVHDGGAMSEPSAFRPVREQSPAHHVRNSADESFMRSTDESVADLLKIHRTLQDKAEDLTAFINQFSSHLGLATNQERSKITFAKCEELKYAIEGVQRRLTPRVD